MPSLFLSIHYRSTIVNVRATGTTKYCIGPYPSFCELKTKCSIIYRLKRAHPRHEDDNARSQYRAQRKDKRGFGIKWSGNTLAHHHHFLSHLCFPPLILLNESRIVDARSRDHRKCSGAPIFTSPLKTSSRELFDWSLTLNHLYVLFMIQNFRVERILTWKILYQDTLEERKGWLWQPLPHTRSLTRWILFKLRHLLPAFMFVFAKAECFLLCWFFSHLRQQWEMSIDSAHFWVRVV